MSETYEGNVTVLDYRGFKINIVKNCFSGEEENCVRKQAEEYGLLSVCYGCVKPDHEKFQSQIKTTSRGPENILVVIQLVLRGRGNNF